MADVVIKSENVSKLYRLGNVDASNFKDDIARVWANIRGLEDPAIIQAESNDRTTKGAVDYVWALRDINFDVLQGDVVGIVGRNGAGKSTLLKLLSKVTAPTRGTIKIKGRIASLLEVGTGFHPELTGKENMYLNGHILGMTKREIDRKFDEIVDFAGVERYLDTPVKRYSSGMYVRLAFAVAAHLEPEILIIDEVLAVGDAEFQKKCLGKINDVNKNEGRTVLFVSHNIASIKSLCKKGILLHNGTLKYAGLIDPTVQQYQELLKDGFSGETNTSFTAIANPDLPSQILSVKVVDHEGNENFEFDVWDSIYIEFQFSVNAANLKFVTPIINVTKDGTELFWSFASDLDPTVLEEWQPGIYKYKVKMPSPLKKGHYSISAKIGKLKVGDLDAVLNAVQFVIDEFSFDPTNLSYAHVRGGIIPAILQWQKLT